MTDAEYDSSVYGVKPWRDVPTGSPSVTGGESYTRIFSITRGGIQFPTEDERTRMKTNDSILTEAQRLREQAEQLERIVDERTGYGADPFKNGTVLKIQMKYRDSCRSYDYAAIKVAGRFYLTGRVQAKPTFLGADTTDVERGWEWENFVAWLAQGDATVWKAGKLEQVL